MHRQIVIDISQREMEMLTLSIFSIVVQYVGFFFSILIFGAFNNIWLSAMQKDMLTKANSQAMNIGARCPPIQHYCSWNEIVVMAVAVVILITMWYNVKRTDRARK